MRILEISWPELSFVAWKRRPELSFSLFQRSLSIRHFFTLFLQCLVNQSNKYWILKRKFIFLFIRLLKGQFWKNDILEILAMIFFLKSLTHLPG